MHSCDRSAASLSSSSFKELSPTTLFQQLGVCCGLQNLSTAAAAAVWLVVLLCDCLWLTVLQPSWALAGVVAVIVSGLLLVHGEASSTRRALCW